MRRTVLICVLALAGIAGCATPQQRSEKLAKRLDLKRQQENTRTIEQLRTKAVEDGEVNSKRGAEILQPNYDQSFDPNTHTSANLRAYGSKPAATKGYAVGKPFRIDKYQTRDFYNSKPDPEGNQKFATKDAPTKGRHFFPDISKLFATKKAPTKESSEAQKTAPTHELADANRPYLGKESKKLRTGVTPKDLANWRLNGETTSYTDGTIEKASSLKPLSIDDIRDLLNKSK